MLRAKNKQGKVMNLRVISTITLSVAFVVLVISGILLYAIPYNFWTGSLHIWAAILFLVCIVLHIKHNIKTYKSHMTKRPGKWSMGLAVFGLIPIAIALAFQLAPVFSVVEFSYNLKTAAAPPKGEYAIVDLTSQLADSKNASPVSENKEPKLSVFFKAGPSYESEPKPIFLNITYTSVPQVVVWMETLDGEYLDTLYITGKTSNSSYRTNDEEPDVVRRPEALPYWSHKRGVLASDGLYMPEQGSNEFDGVTAATPKTDYQVNLPAPSNTKYKLMVEVNRSYDFNEYYSEDRFPEDSIYSGPGSSGQPSLIYEAIVDASASSQTIFNLIGHGHHSGQDGKLYTNLENITSAKRILDFIVASVQR